MARPHFSELILGRRRQLGLSVQQASKILKLKEPVLIAFEEGDWENMPQSGYAQGMLSSYARYLGLNPREVVDLFQEELYEHVNGTASHELRRRTRDTQSGRGITGYEVPNEADSRPKAYVEYHGLLPTAGGPAGDMGAFATTSGVRSRQGGTPQAPRRSHEDATYSHTEYVYGHPNNAQRGRSSEPSRQASRQRPQTNARRRPDNDPTGRLLRESQNGVEERAGDDRTSVRSQRLYRRDDVSRRNVRPNEYDDDLRYDDRAKPYERASTISGRRSSRNIANVDHPNVRRRPASSTSRRRRRRGGVLGLLDDFFSDSRRAIFLIIVVLAVVLTVIVVSSVRSCVSSKTTTQDTHTVAVTSADSSSSSGGTDSDAKDTTTTSTGTTGTTSTGTSGESSSSSSTSTATPVETDVTVTVASGQVSWVEIQCDGVSKVAETITGPWDATYTVTDSITILVSDTNAVQVTKNGETVNFDSKASGIGSVTIAGTPVATDTSTSSDSTSTTGTNTTTTGTTTKTTTGTANV